MKKNSVKNPSKHLIELPIFNQSRSLTFPSNSIQSRIQIELINSRQMLVTSLSLSMAEVAQFWDFQIFFSCEILSQLLSCLANDVQQGYHLERSEKKV